MEQVSDFLGVAVPVPSTPQHEHTCLLSRRSCIAFVYTQTKASSLAQFPHLCCCAVAPGLCAAVVCGVISSSGGTPYSLHSLDPAGLEAKEFHLQQVHKPLPDKVGCMHTASKRANWLSCCMAMQRRMMHVTACCWQERDVDVT